MKKTISTMRVSPAALVAVPAVALAVAGVTWAVTRLRRPKGVKVLDAHVTPEELEHEIARMDAEGGMMLAVSPFV